MFEAPKPSVPVEEMFHLRESIERIRSLIEQVSDRLLESTEKCDQIYMLTSWYIKPKTFRERYIRSVVGQKMFSGFENENFMLHDGALAILDLHTLRIESRKKFMEMSNMSTSVFKLADALFSQFASERKRAIRSELEEAVLPSETKREDLSEIEKAILARAPYLHHALMHQDIDGRLDDLAKEVWAMHKLSLSMEWRVRILRAQKGALFDDRLMEAVNSPPQHDEHGVERARFVESMVMPGFQVLDTLISPCRVSLQ